MTEEMLPPVSPLDLITVCWIDETALKLTLFIAILNFENRKVSPRFAKNPEMMPEECTRSLLCRTYQCPLF
jgi:hypothetical protein